MAVEKMQIEARLKQQMAETAISQNRDGGRLDA
jgi:hypothetical protein